MGGICNSGNRRNAKALACLGLLASMLFVVTDVLAGMLWDGYSFTSRSISELSAVGAPTRPLVFPLNLIYNALLIAFGLGIWGCSQKRALQERYQGPFTPLNNKRIAGLKEQKTLLK